MRLKKSSALLHLLYLLLPYIAISAPKMEDYCHVPNFLTTSFKPNLLIVMDFSGSMQFPSYYPCSTWSWRGGVAHCSESTASSSRYDPDRTYYGYFKSDACYEYDSTNEFFQESTCDCGKTASPTSKSYKVGYGSCLHGNFLNFATMTRLDVARKALTGGRTENVGGSTVLLSEGAYTTGYEDSRSGCEIEIMDQHHPDIDQNFYHRHWNFGNIHNPSTPGSTHATYYTTPYRITRYLYIDHIDNNSSNGCPVKINAARIRVLVNPSEVRGIVHDFCDTSTPSKKIYEACKVDFGFLTYGGSSRRGEVKAWKNNTISQFIDAINTERPRGDTPTGEALFEALDLLKQSNDSGFESNSSYISKGNAEVDPYYTYIGTQSKSASCKKSFILLISDGAWNGDWDPIIPAHQGRITDLRTDLNGTQTVTTYTIFAFSTYEQGLNSMKTVAIFGGFEDQDSNNKPYPFKKYTNSATWYVNITDENNNVYTNSRYVNYPLPQCNPSGTYNSKCIEWDKDKSGSPYNFFYATDGNQFKEAITKALLDILRRASSGSTVATLASRTTVASLLIQPYFYPSYLSSSGDNISWIGLIRSMWIDNEDNLREDTVDKKFLNIAGSSIDKVIKMFFNKSEQKTRIAYLEDPRACTTPSGQAFKDLDALSPIFNPACQLAQRDLSSSPRKILVNKDGTLTSFDETDTTTLVPYIKSIWNGANPEIDTTKKTQCLMRYIKGENVSSDSSCQSFTGLISRKRELDIKDLCNLSSSSTKTWRLGDIIFSTPAVVSNRPNGAYFTLYNDTTYRSYITSTDFFNRATFTFVSANDGMLHTFRVGHLNVKLDAQKPLELVNEPGSSSKDKIGIEEWAFIPQNALPYLSWYGNPNYCHIPTVDYRLMVIDASIKGNATATKDADSWRTLLIGTMGFGGKKLIINDSNNNGVCDTGETGCKVFSSSIFVFDLTDWLDGKASQPTLLWERQLPDNTLTTSFPAIIRQGDGTKNGYWYIAVGSGPLDPSGDNYTQGAIYIFELADTNSNNIYGELVNTIPIPPVGGVSGAQYAVGDILTIDVDLDYQTDVMYFGTYGIHSSGIYGGFYRLPLRTPTGYKDVADLIPSDISQAIALSEFKKGNHIPPVFASPSYTVDANENLWVFLGTGRYISLDDKDSNLYDAYIIGFKDDCWNGTCTTTYTPTDLEDTTSYTVSGDVTLIRNMCICSENGGVESCGLKDAVRATDGTPKSGVSRGWYFKLGGKRVITKPFVLYGALYTLALQPPTDICSGGGETYLCALDYKSGAPNPVPRILSPENATPTGSSSSIGVGETVNINACVRIGYSVPPIGIIPGGPGGEAGDGGQGGPRGKIVIQTGTGEINVIDTQSRRQRKSKGGRHSFTEESGTVSPWFKIEQWIEK